MSEKKKVLMLHGFVQSDKIFSAKTGGLRKNLKKLGYDLYYPCAPHSIDKKRYSNQSQKRVEMLRRNSTPQRLVMKYTGGSLEIPNLSIPFK